MEKLQSRREFLRTAASGATALGMMRSRAAEQAKDAFSFVLLGDLHFDKLEHHDHEWLKINKPDDVRQVADYSRITREKTPGLMETVRQQIAALNRDSATRVAFVLQVGDLVEGLCGNEELALRQNKESIEFVRGMKLGAPFLFTKGNHDVTGPGAREAFQSVFHRFLAEESAEVDSAAVLAKACCAFRAGDAFFCCFDAYDPESLAWLEAALARRTDQHCFVTIHPPVVPYGARSTWHVYSKPAQKTQRDKLLSLLAKNEAIVLSGHIHKYNLLAREAPGHGRLVQLALSSILRDAKVTARNTLNGVLEYNGDQVKVEPAFSPATEPERRAVYDLEAPFVKQFQYADLPGYAIVTVHGARVEARIYSGATRHLWRSVSLSEALRA